MVFVLLSLSSLPMDDLYGVGGVVTEFSAHG